jgi:hypothetical protein
MQGISDRLLNIVVTLVYSALLIFLYGYELSTSWSYMGFDWSLDMFKLATSLIVLAGVTFILPTSASSRDVFLQLCLYFHFTPSLLIFAIQDLPIDYFAAVITGTGLLILFSFTPMRRVKARELNWIQVFWVAALINILVLGAIIVFGGVGNFSLNFGDVYKFRAASNDSLPGIFGYLRPATTKVMLPIILILALVLRSPTLIAFTVFICVVFFGYSHHKVILFASFTAVVLFLAMRRATSSRTIGFLAVILLCVASLSVLYGWYITQGFGADRLTSIVARRSIFVPVLLDSLHIDFFSHNPFYYWSQSSIGLGIAERPFDISAPFIIGNDSMSANTGYIGAGYSNAGMIGVAIYGVVIGLVISYLNEYGKKVGHPLIIAVGFTLIMGAMRGSDLPTIFMTHGLMLLLLFVIFFPGQKDLKALRRKEPKE